MLEDFQGTSVINMPGITATVEDFILEIQNQMPDAILSSKGSPLPIFGKIPTELSWPLSNNYKPTLLRIGITNTLEYYKSGNVNPQNSDDVFLLRR